MAEDVIVVAHSMMLTVSCSLSLGYHTLFRAPPRAFFAVWLIRYSLNRLGSSQ